ncbi:hypothetical protein R1sor_006085 [Riccia sorocarpa]|uniref:Mediator of RNA polymerase II transcription subunit 25 n=1 Tax=Riccia sorocarpa TaxID=122646 RepID=A0ABD3HSX1_9MARC
MMMMNSQQQQPQPQQRQLVVAVEGTAALGPAWPVLQTEYVEKIVRAFYGFNGAGQKSTGSPGDMALVVFTSHGSNGGVLVQRSAWTSNLDLFFRWLSAIHFEGGGFGDAAIAEGLAEALLLMCPGPNVPPVPQVTERQKHCILVAASNPHRLPTAVPSPPVASIVQPQGNGTEMQTDHWILADADTVAQAFAPCSVSLSIISPRQLPMLRNIFSQAKRTSRTADTTSEPPKVSSQHLVLLSEAFLEARMALHRTVVPNMPPNVPKIEQHSNVSVNGSSVTNQMPMAGVRPASGPTAGIGALTGRPVSTLPMQPVTVKTEAGTQGTLNSLLHHNPANSNNMSLPGQQLPSSGGLASPETIQSSLTSIASPDTQQDFKGLGNMQSSQTLRPMGTNVLSSSMMAHSPSQSRHPIGSPSLPPASPLSGLGNSSATGVVTSNVMSNGQNGLGVSGQQQGGVGMGSNTSVGMNSGQVGVGVGSLHGNYNNGTANLVNAQMPGSVQQSNASLVSAGATSNGQGIGVVQGGVAGVSGQGGLAPSNQMGTGGLGPVMGGQVTNGSNAGTASMLPTAGLPQSPGQPQPLSSTTSASVSSHHPTAGAPQPQGFKYTKLWEGILAGQRKGNIVPIPICKLEAYRQTSSETLASDWPPTMQIMRLIPQDYMNQKDYHRKAEIIVFRTLTQHDFLVQLAEKKLCAVIQLPSQTLLLASTEKPGRMIGMLFPGDMVQIKPQVSSQQPQSSTGSTAPPAQSHTVGQSGLVPQNLPMGQNPLSQNLPVGQSTLSQGHPVTQSGLLQNHTVGQSGLSHNHTVGQVGLSQTHTVGQGGLTSSALGQNTLGQGGLTSSALGQNTLGQGGLTSSALGQSTLGQNTLGQSGFVQNQLQSQLQNQIPGVNQLSNSQVSNAQARNQLMSGSAGLHGSSFLP